MDTEIRAYSSNIFNNILQNISIGCVKEMSLGDVSFTFKKHMFESQKTDFFWIFFFGGGGEGRG